MIWNKYYKKQVQQELVTLAHQNPSNLGPCLEYRTGSPQIKGLRSARLRDAPPSSEQRSQGRLGVLDELGCWLWLVSINSWIGVTSTGWRDCKVLANLIAWTTLTAWEVERQWWLMIRIVSCVAGAKFGRLSGVKDWFDEHYIHSTTDNGIAWFTSKLIGE